MPVRPTTLIQLLQIASDEPDYRRRHTPQNVAIQQYQLFLEAQTPFQEQQREIAALQQYAQVLSRYIKQLNCLVNQHSRV